jgi:hypothetical protein
MIGFLIKIFFVRNKLAFLLKTILRRKKLEKMLLTWVLETDYVGLAQFYYVH